MERQKGDSRQILVQGKQQQFPQAALKLKLKIKDFFSIFFAVVPKKITMGRANFSKALDYYYL